jgi:hypothetical protein
VKTVNSENIYIYETTLLGGAPFQAHCDFVDEYAKLKLLHIDKLVNRGGISDIGFEKSGKEGK